LTRIGVKLDHLTSGSKDREGYRAAQRALLGAAVHWLNDQSRQFLSKPVTIVGTS
jgi:hypothetical protein